MRNPELVAELKTQIESLSIEQLELVHAHLQALEQNKLPPYASWKMLPFTVKARIFGRYLLANIQRLAWL